jgi:hypothetical protein
MSQPSLYRWRPPKKYAPHVEPFEDRLLLSGAKFVANLQLPIEAPISVGTPALTAKINLGVSGPLAIRETIGVSAKLLGNKDQVLDLDIAAKISPGVSPGPGSRIEKLLGIGEQRLNLQAKVEKSSGVAKGVEVQSEVELVPVGDSSPKLGVNVQVNVPGTENREQPPGGDLSRNGGNASQSIATLPGNAGREVTSQLVELDLLFEPASALAESGSVELGSAQFEKPEQEIASTLAVPVETPGGEGESLVKEADLTPQQAELVSAGALFDTQSLKESLQQFLGRLESVGVGSLAGSGIAPWVLLGLATAAVAGEVARRNLRRSPRRLAIDTAFCVGLSV